MKELLPQRGFSPLVRGTLGPKQREPERNWHDEMEPVADAVWVESTPTVSVTFMIIVAVLFSLGEVMALDA